MSKTESANTQNIAYCYVLYKYDGTQIGHWGMYESLAEVAKANLTDVAQFDLVQISVEYYGKTLLPADGIFHSETYYVADRVQTFGEICVQNGVPSEHVSMDVDPNVPAVLLCKAPNGFGTHILDPQTDIVFNRRFEQIYPPVRTR